MARTLDPAAHAQRRDAFVDAGQVLVQTRGYEAFSVQDVLDAVGSSKGAFYHYFQSKDDLVDAVVTRMAGQATAVVDAMIDSPDLTAVEKLGRLFNGLAQFKAERKDLVLGILRVWISESNAIVRERSRRLVKENLVPWLERIIAQGIDEGTFQTGHPEKLARVLSALIVGMQEMAVELWVARQEGAIPIEEVFCTFDAYQEAFERIVGVPPGTLTFLDRDAIEFWFGG
jgi:AcrR family transcriptional regulator